MNHSDLADAGDSRSSVNDCWKQIGVWGKRDCPELALVAHCRNCPVFTGAAARLLDREPPAGYLDQWTAHYARPDSPAELDSRSVVLFRVGTEWLALPAPLFQEIAEWRPIRSLPHRRSPMVLGLANIRGELLICVSLSQLLGLEAAPAPQSAHERSASRRLLVLNRKGDRLVFPADEVHGVHRYRPRELRSSPATVAHAAATFTLGVLPWQDRAVGCLDDGLVFQAVNRSLD